MLRHLRMALLPHRIRTAEEYHLTVRRLRRTEFLPLMRRRRRDTRTRSRPDTGSRRVTGSRRTMGMDRRRSRWWWRRRRRVSSEGWGWERGWRWEQWPVRWVDSPWLRGSISWRIM
uniref:Uncharacterized protein n=1 Tax=Opuntia streptacantha TaxID=393608 RepID=A0A7C9DB32_OPUST